MLNTLADCSSGAHSLSKPGDRVYPEMGNGGYKSLHTDLYLNYDAIMNVFKPGTHADLQVKSTQCLSDLSFDFEQTNGHTADGTGPNMTVDSVSIDGTPASFRFVQPTYPGDPNGQDDPDPAAHAVSNSNPVSADEPEPARLLAAGQQRHAERDAMPGEQARRHAVGADPRRDDGHGHDQLHGPARRAHRRRRLDRGLVPHRDCRRRGLVRDDRAGRQRLVDADEQPPAGEADLRHLRHDEHRQGRHRSR